MKILPTILAIAITTSCWAAEEDHSRTLSVSGSGTVQVIATIADVTLGAETIAPVARDAQDKLATVQKSILDALRAESSAEEVESKNITLYPRYAKNDYTQVVGYTASSDITFTSTVEEAGRLIAVGIEAGANKNKGVSVRADEATLHDARVEALKRASGSAMEEGKVVLEALGLTYQGIHKVEVGARNNYQPVFRAYKMEASDMAASAPVEVTEQELDINAHVALVLKYLQ